MLKIKLTAILIVISLVALSVAGYSGAWFTATAGPLENIFIVEIECKGDTAYGGNTRGDDGTGRWWNYFYIGDGETQKVVAGSTRVEMGEVTITDTGIQISLDSGWSLQDSEEAVKIKAYETQPTLEPPGSLDHYKGESLTVSFADDDWQGPEERLPYYVIHLDVQSCE